MLHISVKVSGASIEVSASEPLTSGTVGATASFSFDDTWDGLTKTAVFRSGGVTRDVVNISRPVIVPWEVLTKAYSDLYVGVYGTDDENIGFPTLWAKVGTIQPGADPSGDESADPSPLVWEQMLAVAQEAKAVAQSVRTDADNGVFNGDDGASVYHEWMGTELIISSLSGTSSADLKGERGDTGETGAKGDKGDAGKDGYTPRKGVDYFTPDEKAELVKEIEETAIGDIDAALDGIIAIQAALIGGGDV